MDSKLQKKINGMLDKRKEKNRKTIMLSVISVVLAVTVSYLSVFPAITKTNDPVCGMPEHTHTAACYQDVLVCGKEEGEGHVHTDACYQEVKTLDCEQEEHVHTDACYEDVLVCEQEEHVHTDACYEEVKTLICSLEEDENHTHTDTCYKTEKVLTCGKEEHNHTDACYEKQLVCGLQEHTHTDSCYKTERVLTCGKEEYEPHTHTEACYEKQLICGMEEHVHTQDCYAHEAYKEDLLRVYEDNDVTVTVTLAEGSMIPADAELVVSPITAEQNEAAYNALVEKAGDTVLGENQVISDIKLYDISFNLNGENVEPAEGTVKVSIRFNTPVFSVEAVERASELKVLHFEDSGEVVDVTDIIENAEAGVTAVEFDTDSFSPFCIVLADTTQTGNFYQRVTTIDSTTASYLIVSAQGNYALSSTQTGNSRLATINPVKGNPTYYNATIGASDAANITDINWRFSALIPGTSGNSAIQVNATQRLRLNNNNIIGTTVQSLTLAYAAPAGCWTIVQGGYYLYMSVGTNGVFSRNNGTTAPENRNVVIYKLVNTTLTIPGDVIYDDGTGQGSGGTKPPYPGYIAPSGAQSATYTTGGGNKTFSAVSDPASSQIENKFTGVKADDGKVVTDKSVVYGDDDYGAFNSYNDGIFGVTMSALAQEFNIAVVEEHEAPIDVVIIFDNSGSMVNNNVPGSPTRSRAAAAVPALNDTIDFIMLSNPNNRVGIVNFSSGSADFMQLDRYYVGTAGATPNYNSPGYNYMTMSAQTGTGTLSTDTNLRYAITTPAHNKGVAVPVTSITNWNGTYTQTGIAQAAEMLFRNTDTTYTEDGVTVERVPVYILVSDGDPTHCTSNYMDVLKGPHYGSGVYTDAANNRGIQGYNTILSANYYKKMASIHYAEVAKFFSIGLGINATGYDDMSGGSATGDHYKRTVLNPTVANIDYLLSATAAKNYTLTALQLYQLLNGTYTGSNVLVGTSNAYANLGTTNRNVPVLMNQYTNYKYADDAFFGNFTTAELTAALQGAIVQSRSVYNYGFILQNSTDVDMNDLIGLGMEVKGPPVLRHNGINYTYTSTDTATNAGITTVTYHYNYTTTDPFTAKEYTLDDIIVTVMTDNTSGTCNQCVHLFVPEHDLPVYQPDEAQSFYYENLPVRLIYQVGLTPTALAGAQKNDVFYTNRWDAGITTTAEFFPTGGNPYYVVGTYQNLTENKSANPTATLPTRFLTTLAGLDATHNLGNNGKLVVTDALEDVAVTVDKAWYQYDGSQIIDPGILAGLPDVTVSLYQSTVVGVLGTLYDTVTFGNNEGWTYTWPTLPNEDGGGNPYYYSVVEAGVDGYYTEYQNNGGILNGSIIINNTAGGMILPATGGIGIYWYMMSGFFILLLTGCFLYKEKRRKGGKSIRSPDG